MRGADARVVPDVQKRSAVHPHMRGADDVPGSWADYCSRFIPTCVGQMMRSIFDRSSSVGSSPHAWGRCGIRCVILTHAFGSSPHAWGRCVTARGINDNLDGSSPHAWGRCAQTAIHIDRFTVHPHMRGADSTPGCGERSERRFIPTCVGQIVLKGWQPLGSTRFIPTCVGQMPDTVPAPNRMAVHPHMRGADGRRHDHACGCTRFIPTCVGQIMPFAYIPVGKTVHPHMRGADG